MIKFDEEALICDLAETYNIYDYRQLPLTKVAVFSCGLRDNSRIKMKMSGQQVSLDTLLLANVSDKLGLLVWYKTKDAQKGANQPKSMVETLTNVKTETIRKELVFDSGEEFEKARQALIKGGG
ncbi:DUF5361 domain-containing protein [Vagococcus xieshaowenii]|uniref:Phage protein n=1 Tax=Vagococcus xieshaowenii TaxID=2562451 RepID=A0AAJ5EEJ1_9ENTE|nr:DUF5361 domain-containing protein [Vagococcus xieshaowenii]QCA28259.1 hypothetical protein E4Z98_02610 [Vagococcus xieshaowenii]TFZ41913.1 hypothetical protein E4031_04790 [Vagococcus xieshaowenii]